MAEKFDPRDPDKQAEEAAVEGERLQEGRGRAEGQKCDGKLEGEVERSEEDDEIDSAEKLPERNQATKLCNTEGNSVEGGRVMK